MAGIAEKETKTASPEKIQNGDSAEKAEVAVKNSHPVEKEVEEVEEKVSENGKTTSPKKNGSSTAEEVQQNGHEEEKVEESEEKESTEEVDAVKEPVSDACCLKRKSTGGDVTAEETATEVTSPKKAKLDDKVVSETESNGCQNKA